MTNRSSMQSPIPFEQMPEPSPFINSNSENKPCKDEICVICRKWCVDSNDFMINFISCKFCAQSYHKQCIPNNHHQIHSITNCNDIKNRKTKQTLRCAPEQREPLLLLEIIDSEFESMRYVYDLDDKPIYYHPNNQQNEKKILQENNIGSSHSENIFTRTKCRKIKWKGIYYQIGESIEIKNEPNQIWKTNIAIIKEIFIYNEPNTLPTFSIFWYWREKELNHHLYHVKGIKTLKFENISNTEERRRYIDHHLYIDIEYEANRRKEIEVSAASVLHKVVVCENFDDFIDLKDTKLKEYGDVYYGTYSFTMENYTKYNSSPFERVNMKEFRKKIHEMSIISEEEYNKRKQELKNKNEIKKVREESMDKVRRYLNHYYTHYIEGDDEWKCLDINIPFDLKEKAKGEYEKKLPLQRGRRLIVDEIDMEMEQSLIRRNHNNDNDDIDDIDMNEENKNGKMKKKRKKPVKLSVILEKNKKEIGKNEKKEMMDICTKLGIKRGIHIGITVYGYNSHLEVYQEIMRLIKMTNDEEKKWKGYIGAFNSSKLRDIKSKIQSEGKCGRKNEMIDGICKKLKELKENYKRNNNHNNNNNNNNNMKMEVDDIEDSEDELLFVVDNNHNNKKRIRYDGYDDIININNNKNKRRKIGNHTPSSVICQF